MEENGTENKDGEQEKDPSPIEISDQHFSLSKSNIAVDLVSAKAWISLIAIGVILISMMLWSFLGSLPIKVEGRGIIMNSNGLFIIQSKTSAVVKSLLFSPGDYVEKGELIAELSDSDLELEYENIFGRITDSMNDLNNLKLEIATEKAANDEALNNDIKAKQFTVDQIKINIEQLEEDIKKKIRLVEDGLISKNILKQDEEKLISKKIEMETTLAGISSLKAQIIKKFRQEDLQKKEEEVQKVKITKESLDTKLSALKVHTPFSGNILEWLVNLGDFVSKGTHLVWIEHASGKNDTGTQTIFAYVPVDKGKRISVGNIVQISPSSVNVQEYGYMLGTVTDVSLYAISSKNIANLIQNKGLSEYLTNKSDVVIQITINPILDPNDPSGYKWTSGRGPFGKISTGTVCTIQTVVQRVRPLHYIVPLYRFSEFLNVENEK